MDGSDDYFSDEIFLDDQALAVLDQEEQKYLTQVTQRTALPPVVVQRVSKRKRSNDDSIKRDVRIRPHPMDEIEDLPEITLQDDGSYQVHGAPSKPKPVSTVGNGVNSNQTTSTSKNIVQPNHPTTVRRSEDATPQASSRTVSVDSRHTSHNRTTHSIQSNLPQSQSSLGKRSRSSVGARPVAIPPPPVPAPPIRNAPPPYNIPSNIQSQTSLGKRTRLSVDARPRNSTSLHVPSPLLRVEDALHPLAKQIEELEKKLQEMGQENAKVQAALQAAEDAKIAKAGEVAVLRRTIDKTAQDHAVHVANLKAARDEADAKQAQMQKSMREEVERMKTQFIFKQHELETLNRKPPLSVRPQRIFKEPPSTPMTLPSQIRGWNQSGPNNAGPSVFMEDTPRRPTFQGNVKGLSKVPHNSPEKPKKSNALPGFHNAFMTSTPLRPSQQRLNKGKQREIRGTQLHDAPFPSAFHIPVSPPSSPIHHPRRLETNVRGGYPTNPQDEPVPAQDFDVDGDVEMADDDETMIFEEAEEEVDPVEPFNWKIELNRIILTDTLSPLATPSFQTILEAAATVDLPPETAQIYSAACSRVLEVISATFKHHDFEKALDNTSYSLSTMIPILSNAKLIQHLPLAALLSLLTALSYALPNFGSVLLAYSPDGDSNILICVSEIIRNHLESSEEYVHKGTLAKEVVSLLEALCFHTKDELVQNLTFIPRTHSSILALLHNYQPSWLLTRSVRLLVLLATHSPLCRALVSMADPNLPQVSPSVTPGRPPLVERLCYHLTETNRKDAESHDFKTSILSLFALLSYSQPEVHSVLVGSAIFIPTLIVFLSQLTTPIWDDDEDLIDASPDVITLAIRTLNQTLFLLHHLIFSTTPVFNLKQKLSSVNGIRHFNGLTHTFIVTFGRLCYADTPGWVNQEGSRELVLLTDMAREILDLVVDGPECDNIWQAYHIEPDNASQTDEEEMEANLLGEQ